MQHAGAPLCDDKDSTVADIDPTDFEFLSVMNRLLGDGASIARAYLANSNPETRRANVADFARTAITEHDNAMKQVTAWLEEATPPPPADGMDRPVIM